jgi:hypothetical protein
VPYLSILLEIKNRKNRGKNLSVDIAKNKKKMNKPRRCIMELSS